MVFHYALDIKKKTYISTENSYINISLDYPNSDVKFFFLYTRYAYRIHSIPENETHKTCYVWNTQVKFFPSFSISEDNPMF